MMKKVLVVDNHPMILKFMKNLIEKEGYEVKSAVDGLSALDVLGTFVPDIMFVDLVMPNISGEKLCKIVRSNPKLRDVFICILSAIAAEAEVDHTAFGANACIAKGPLNKMSQYVFSMLNEAENGTLCAGGGKPIGLDEVYKRHITKELLHSKRHFEIILGNMSQGIIELNPEGRIVYVNQVALSLIALSEENLLGSSIVDLFQGEYRKIVQNMLEDAKQRSLTVAEDSPLILNGKEISLVLIPVRDEHRFSNIVIVDDVGERRRMKFQLLQAQRMKAISTLAGGIAHEFNNALQGITGNLDLMELKIKEGEVVEHFLYPMKSSIERMSSLTNQLLAYSQGGKYQPKVISLSAFVEETLLSVQHTLCRQIHIETSLEPDIFSVRADLTQLQMVILAVLHNAEEAVEGEGRIRIITRNAEIREKLTRNQFEIHPGSYVCLCIEDNGKGMDQETRLRVFEPFFSTKFQGRGFSMAAVYGVVQNHNGWIDIESQVGKGSSVCIYLPATEDEEEPTPEGTFSILPGAATVLVVEDEESVLQVTADMLKTIGYQVLEARTGKEAVKIVHEYEGHIHVAILDLGLPDMEGSSAFGQLRQARPDMKVLLSSGYSIDGPAQEIIDKGADGFLQKPYTLLVLSEELRDILMK